MTPQAALGYIGLAFLAVAGLWLAIVGLWLLVTA